MEDHCKRPCFTAALAVAAGSMFNYMETSKTLNKFKRPAELCSVCFDVGYTISEFILEFATSMLISSIGVLSFCMDGVHGVESSCLQSTAVNL